MSKGTRRPLAEAEAIAKQFILQNNHLFKQVLICGSIRRKRETVGDLDLVVIPDAGYEQAFPKNRAIFNGMAVQIEPTIDLFWGAAVLYRTGSQEFNIYMRSIAKSQGLKLNERGLWKGADRYSDAPLQALAEEDIFRALGIQYVEPERRNREDHGEWQYLRSVQCWRSESVCST